MWSKHQLRFRVVAAATFLLFAAPEIVQAQTAMPAGHTSAGLVRAAPAGTALEGVLFNLVAGPVVIAALGVCIARNIVRMAVWLFFGLGSVAMLYFLLAAPFLAAIQLIVYAGGTLVLLIFGVMLTSKSPWVRFDPGRLELLVAALVCGSLIVALGIVLTRAVWFAPPGTVSSAPVAELGRRLLTDYLIPFEVAGVLLMIVMVGAAYLARQER